MPGTLSTAAAPCLAQCCVQLCQAGRVRFQGPGVGDGRGRVIQPPQIDERVRAVALPHGKAGLERDGPFEGSQGRGGIAPMVMGVAKSVVVNGKLIPHPGKEFAEG